MLIWFFYSWTLFFSSSSGLWTKVVIRTVKHRSRRWTVRSVLPCLLHAVYSPMKNYDSITTSTVLEMRRNDAHAVPPTAVASLVYHPNRNLQKRGNQIAGKQRQRRRRGRDWTRRFAMMEIVLIVGTGVSCCCAVDMVAQSLPRELSTHGCRIEGMRGLSVAFLRRVW